MAEQRHNPMWLEAEEALSGAGKRDEAFARVIEAFDDANEDPAAFRITSRYYLMSLTV